METARNQAAGKTRFAAAIAVSIVLAATLIALLWLRFPPETTTAPPAGYTPIEDMRVTGYEPWDRIQDQAAYRLRIHGLVAKEIELDLEEIRFLPHREIDAKLPCVLGWSEYAKWEGPPLRDVLALAEPIAAATHVSFSDEHSYTTSLSLQYVNSGEPILAHALYGQSLPREHGWPVRVVAPGKWGYKWIKWVTDIEVTNRGYEGTYEGRGYSLDGNADEPKREADKE